MHPALTPAKQASTRFRASTRSAYPRWVEGWVDLGVGYILRWFICSQTVIRLSSKRLIVTWPGVEIMRLSIVSPVS